MARPVGLSRQEAAVSPSRWPRFSRSAACSMMPASRKAATMARHRAALMPHAAAASGMVHGERRAFAHCHRRTAPLSLRGPEWMEPRVGGMGSGHVQQAGIGIAGLPIVPPHPHMVLLRSVGITTGRRNCSADEAITPAADVYDAITDLPSLDCGTAITFSVHDISPLASPCFPEAQDQGSSRPDNINLRRL